MSSHTPATLAIEPFGLTGNGSTASLHSGGVIAVSERQLMLCRQLVQLRPCPGRRIGPPRARSADTCARRRAGTRSGCGSATSCTQRSSYFPESFQVRVAGGPYSGPSGNSTPDLMRIWNPLQIPRMSFPAALNVWNVSCEVVPDLVGQDPAGGDVVPVAESARQAQHLVVVREPGVLEQAIDVDQIRAPARLLERKRRFAIAVGSRSTQDEDAGRGHESIVSCSLYADCPEVCQGFGWLAGGRLMPLQRSLPGLLELRNRQVDQRPLASRLPSADHDRQLFRGLHGADPCARDLMVAHQRLERRPLLRRHFAHEPRVRFGEQTRDGLRGSSRWSEVVGHIADIHVQRRNRRQTPFPRRPRPAHLRSGRGNFARARSESPDTACRKVRLASGGSTWARGHPAGRGAGHSASRPVRSACGPTWNSRFPGSFASIVTHCRTSGTCPRALISSDAGMAMVCF